jgi:cytochrome c peroxidase
MVVTKSTIALLLFAIASVASTVAYRGATATDRLTAHADTTISPFAPVRQPVGLDRGKVALGQRLFLDPIISGKNALTCDSCHDLNKGGTVGSRRTIGYQGKMHRFNAPTIFNVGNNYRLGWRGDFTSLEEQNEKVLLDENLMAVDWPTLLARLRSSEAYGGLFKSVYGRRADRDSVLDALATFQRSLVTTDAPFDRYLTGNQQAISEEAARGFELFRTYGCSSCHQGSNIGGNMFQKFGIFAEPLAKGENVSDGDLGRWTITGVDRDIGVFRVPSLRNVQVTAPYFHDGRTDTLAEAVEIMARSQLGREVSPVDLRAIVAFLETLTGEYNGRKLSASPLEERP